MSLAGFDLNLLKVLDAMLREGSTTAAAQRLGLSQPAVSAALGRLRHALGDELFVRAGAKLRPTAVALELADDLAEALTAVERVVAGAGALDPARLSRTFRLSGGDYMGDVILPPVMARLQREAPGVRIEHLDEVFAASLGRIREGEFDLVLLPRFEFPADVDWRPIFRSGFRIVARPGHPRLARAGIAAGDVIPLDLFCDIPQARYAVEPGIDTPSVEDERLAEVGRKRRVQMTLPGFASIVEVVAATDLLAVLPALTAERAGGRLERFGAPIPLPPLTLCLAWHRRLTRSPAHRWLRDLIAGEAARLHPEHPLRPEDHEGAVAEGP